MDNNSKELLKRKGKREYKKQFYHKNHINFIGAIIGNLGIAAINIGIAFILQIILDVATRGELDKLKKVIIGTVIYLGIIVIVLTFKRFFYNRFIKKAIYQYKNYVFKQIMKKNINSFNKESSSNYLSAFSNDLTSIERNYLGSNMDIVYQLILLIGGLLSMAYLNWKMLLCVIVTSLLSVVLTVLFGGKLAAYEVKVSDYNASFVAMMKDLLSGFSVIKSFKAEKEISTIFEEANNSLESVKKARRDMSDYISLLSFSSGYLVNVSIFALGGYLAIKGEISIGVVVAVIQLVNYVVNPIQALGEDISGRKAAKALLNKIQLITELSESTVGTEVIEDFNNGIVLENVTFGYDESSNNLENINLKFEKGKSYAIVGGSGSGKSTLLNLLLGYHTNYTGKICFDDKELKELNADNLYDLVSVIQQNVFVFDNSIIDNITMFKKFNESTIERSIKQAGLDKLIIEKGQDYSCGENGVNLSGGEKQRISIARSLIRDAKILLMDEGTSALDNSTAQMVEEAILGIDKLTRIIITHKLNPKVLNMYDQIIVLNKGMIVEQGSYKELMDKEDYFYRLYNIANAV